MSFVILSLLLQNQLLLEEVEELRRKVSSLGLSFESIKFFSLIWTQIPYMFRFLCLALQEQDLQAANDELRQKVHNYLLFSIIKENNLFSAH